MNFARLIRMSRVKFYELWKQGKGPKFYWNGKCRRITHRANNPTHSILAAAMNLDAKSKLPCQAKSPTFVFCEARAPGYAVLELDTATNTVRVFLLREQIERLTTEARTTIIKLAS